MTDAGAVGDGGLSTEAAGDVATVAKGGATQIVGQISHRSLSFFFNMIALRILGAAGFGLLAQLARVLQIAGQLGLAGFNYAAMRFIARARATGDHGQVRGAARSSLRGAAAASLLVMAAVYVGADALATVFTERAAKRDEFAYLLRIGFLFVPAFAFMQVLRYCTQGYKTMVPSVIVGNIVQPAARFLLGVIALLAGWAVAGAVTSLVASMAIGAVAGAYYYRRILTEEEQRARPRAPVGEMIRFALPQGGASLLGIQALGLGVLILGIVRESDAPAGVFAAALALQGPAGVFLSGIVNIWAPVVSDLYERGEIERLGSLYQTITRWVATFSFPILAALVLEPDLFVRLFGGQALAGEAGAEAARVVAILALGNLFYTGTGPTGYVISMTGRPGVNFVNSVVAVIAYATLGIWAAREHGAVGMAVVDAAVTAAINTIRVIEAKVLVGVQPFGRSFLKPVGATLVGGAALFAWRFLPPEGTWMEVAGIVVGGGIFLAVLRALGVDAEERFVWERIKKRALRRRS